MTILDRIEGVRSEAVTAPRLSQKDVGVDYLGEHAGGCSRAGYYRAHDATETNPQADRLTVARHVHNKIVDLYVGRMMKVTAQFLGGIIDWRIEPESGGSLDMKLDYMYKEEKQIVGVIIFTGSGYGFRAEVFGTKFKEGSVKVDHLVQCWTILTTSPLPLARLEIVYVDRDRGDDINYVLLPSQVPITKEDIDTFITTSVQQELPPCSYKKQWTNAEEVAKIYAEKQISKARYQTWKDSGIGGDWHCEYCPFLKRCEEDGET